MRLETLLASELENAAVLRANGHAAQAASIERVVAGVKENAALYLEWLSESDARMRSGKGVDFFRARFATWERDGLAELRGRTRYYRGVVVPRRTLLSLVRAEAAQVKSA
jgi:hypothetical protein